MITWSRTSQEVGDGGPRRLWGALHLSLDTFMCDKPGARLWGGAARDSYARIAHATPSCAVVFVLATIPFMLRTGVRIVCITLTQGIIHVATCHIAQIQLEVQGAHLDPCCQQCNASCPIMQLHIYSLWGSNPRPMAHKTIALATELRELDVIKRSGGCTH